MQTPDNVTKRMRLLATQRGHLHSDFSNLRLMDEICPIAYFLHGQESSGAPKQSACETHCPQPAPVGHQLNLAHHLPKLTNGKIARQKYNRIIENLIKRFSNSREIKRSGFLLQPLQFENEINPRTARLIRQPMLAIARESAIADLRLR